MLTAYSQRYGENHGCPEDWLWHLEGTMENDRANGVWHYRIQQDDVIALIAEVRRLREEHE